MIYLLDTYMIYNKVIYHLVFKLLKLIKFDKSYNGFLIINIFKQFSEIKKICHNIYFIFSYIYIYIYIYLIS